MHVLVQCFKVGDQLSARFVRTGSDAVSFVVFMPCPPRTTGESSVCVGDYSLGSPTSPLGVLGQRPKCPAR